MGSVMKCIVFELVLFIFAGAQPSSLANYSPNLQPANPERDAVTRRFNYFDLEILKEISEYPGNFFISPASIKTTLALILEGAKGKSAVELGNALRIDNIEQKEIREILERLLFDLNDKTTNTLLESANALFVSDQFDLIPDYEKKVKRNYKSAVTKVDFTNPTLSAKIINSWASNATHGLINQIVGGGLFPDTSMVLANALYFKGKWKTEFNISNTKEKNFNSPTLGRVNTPMMELSHSFNYNFNIDLNAYAVELPYQDDKYAMLILLPTNGNNVRTLARDMQHAQLNMVIDALKPTDLILEIPRFEIEYQADLVPYLRLLKIQEIFGGRANLTGMIPQDGVKISNIIHKGKIEVNEQGTEAAVITTAVVIPLMGTTAHRITADQPFIFFIYHKESRNIIFEGLFSEPQVTAPPKNVRYSSNQYPQQTARRVPYSQYGQQRSNIRFS